MQPPDGLELYDDEEEESAFELPSRVAPTTAACVFNRSARAQVGGPKRAFALFR
jgi:hypothetical protein